MCSCLRACRGFVRMLVNMSYACCCVYPCESIHALLSLVLFVYEVPDVPITSSIFAYWFVILLFGSCVFRSALWVASGYKSAIQAFPHLKN